MNKMTIKRFKLFLASSIEKEEEWLTEMSKRGLHFKKYRLFTYYFDENPDESYIYQIDFREADDDYFQLYQDAGWQYVDSSIKRFHYFCTKAGTEGSKKIYSDSESVKETLQRMMAFYIAIFFAMITSQIGLIVTWEGWTIQVILAVFIAIVIILYLYMFYTLKRKINYYYK
ncbi:Protein of uncharacterised function (DUF2812) [Lederbergia lenta]|uniref:Protein of uncharacterized function (DUF2812) n=2 Tax=Lederbergia lenta TaxID=1467 RepID=A0A2X4VKQ4_LEDLE|nr:Protein of uncharacterised function (DUF2812) [Lederbergia lenta]